MTVKEAIEHYNREHAGELEPETDSHTPEELQGIIDGLTPDFNIHYGKPTNADMKVFRDNAKPNDILINYDGRTYIVIEPKGNDVDETVFMKELTTKDNDIYLHVKR